MSGIRAGSINSLTEASLQAQVCNQWYSVLRDQLLRDSEWQFAHKIKALAVLTDELFNWAYVYQYPSDCLNINRVMLNIEEVNPGTSDTVSRYAREDLPRINLRSQVEYQIYNIDGNRVIASNDADLRIDYRAMVEDPNLFDTIFTIALSHLLSSYLAIPLVGTEQGMALQGRQLQLYQATIDAAGAADGNEQYITHADSDFINVRN